MKATQLLHNLGQSLWLDNITRDLLNSGTLKRYIDEFSVTGLTSNPTIFDQAVKNSVAYDAAIREELAKGKTGEALFFDLALEDLMRAADLFRPIHDRTNGVDGWVSLEVSPLLAHNTASTIAAAKELSTRAGRPNLFIKIPGTNEGLPAIEEAIFAGVPINVTLLFSREQYVATAEAYLRGIERRIAAGLNPQIGSVASIFISRWDVVVAGKVPEALNNRLGIAVAGNIYKAYVEVLCNPRWQRVYNAGARPQRLLWASTGTKDPKASDVLYIKALAAPFTVNTMPEQTLKALAEHGELGSNMAVDGGDCQAVLAQFAQAGINVGALAAQLQDEGAKSFVKSWNELIAVIASKSAALKKAAYSYALRPDAPRRFKTQVVSPDNEVTEEDCAQKFMLSSGEILRAIAAKVQVQRRTLEVFTHQVEMDFTNAAMDPDQAARVAYKVLTKNESFDARELRRALLRKLKTNLKELALDQADDNEQVTHMLNVILCARPEILYQAQKAALATNCEVEQTEEGLPAVLEHDAPLPTSRLNVYRVMPPGLNSWERPFAEMLDRDTQKIVRWWHRNPDRKPWSVSVVLDDGRNFFPDFVIGVEGRKCEDGGLLADPKFAFEITQEQPKTHAEHPVYGRVLVLSLLGGAQWMTVRFDEKQRKAVLDREFRLSDAAGY